MGGVAVYNRYVRNDQGTYSRIPMEDAPPQRSVAEPPAAAHSAYTPQSEYHASPNIPIPPPSASKQESDERESFGLSGFLRRLLDRFHLEKVDSGDLLLLMVLFLLFKEDADDELLIALGLLLILQ